MSLQCQKCKDSIGKISNSPQFNCHDCWSKVTKQLSELQEKYDRAVDVIEDIEDSGNESYMLHEARKFLKSIESSEVQFEPCGKCLCKCACEEEENE